MYSCERDFEATDLKAGGGGTAECVYVRPSAAVTCQVRPALGHIELSSWDSARTLTCIAPSSVRFKSRVAAAAAAVTAAVANIGRERHESTR